MYDIEKSIGFLLAKSYQRAFAIMKEEIDRYDLTPPQFGLLAFLWKEDGLTQVELAERGQIDRTTLGGLVDRLVKIGFVERKVHPTDRRAYKIYLTDSGKNIQLQLSECGYNALKKLTNGLNEDEISELRRMLEIIRGDKKIYEMPNC